jgi:hypothetical protein
VFRIIESYTEAKNAATPSEDGMAASPFYAAVIDGATSTRSVTSGATTADLPGTPGRMAMETIRQCIAGFPPGLTLRQTADWLTEAVRSLWEIYEPLGQRPTASVVLYSAARREVWQVGDCPFLLDGVEYRGAKAVDRLLANLRARTTRRLLAEGRSTDELLATDPGRQAILPYLRAQVRLQNAAPTQRRAFGVVDGSEIPDAHLRVYPLTEGPHSLILASDGYPQLLDTLEATEAHLHELLAADPLCIGPLLGTKGVRPGAASYDDRTYLRLDVE